MIAAGGINFRILLTCWLFLRQIFSLLAIIRGNCLKGCEKIHWTNLEILEYGGGNSLCQWLRPFLVAFI